MTKLDYHPIPVTKWDNFKLLVLPFLATCALFYAVWYYTHADNYPFENHSEIPSNGQR